MALQKSQNEWMYTFTSLICLLGMHSGGFISYMSYVSQVLSSSKLHCGVEVSVSWGTPYYKTCWSFSPLILQCRAICWKRGREFLPILFMISVRRIKFWPQHIILLWELRCSWWWLKLVSALGY